MTPDTIGFLIGSLGTLFVIAGILFMAWLRLP